MRKGLRSEIRMLREIAWFFLRHKKCKECGLRFVSKEEADALKFGHRKHPPIKVIVTVHHEDEDREHNEDKNLKWVHRSCHKAHHLNDARKKVRLWNCVVYSTRRKNPKERKIVIRAGTKRRALVLAEKKELHVVSIKERR